MPWWKPPGATDATPPDRVAVPRNLGSSSEKETVPVGVPAAEVTTAVKVTPHGLRHGLPEEVKDVEVEAGPEFTTWVNGADVLGAKLLEP